MARQWVTYDRFLALMDQELRTRPEYVDEMAIQRVGGGHDLYAPSLSITARQALLKEVFDRVSLNYTITKEDM